MRCCFDTDRVIAVEELGVPYKDRKPYPWAVELINKLYDWGHYIIITTSRYSRQLDGDFAKIWAVCEPELKTWLNKHRIKHHKVWPGKPDADMFLDDKGREVNSEKPSTWKNLINGLVETLSYSQFLELNQIITRATYFGRN